MFVEIQGDSSGRRWRYHPVQDRLEVNGERYKAVDAEDGSLACLQRWEVGTHWDEEVARLRVAIGVARMPEIAAAPTIRRLLDVRDQPRSASEFGPPASLIAVWEWADVSFKALIETEEDLASQFADVKANVTAALEALHGIGIIHLDVAPNNVLRVQGTWKLAGLDSAVERGAPAGRAPRPPYVHPDHEGGQTPAREEFDWYGLEQVLVAMKREPSSSPNRG
jgi:hypothetical protein